MSHRGSMSSKLGRGSSLSSFANEDEVSFPDTVGTMSVHLKGGLTRLFNELDGDKDGYLKASDLGLLARAILGKAVPEADAISELQRAKLEAEKHLGAKETFQKDVLCLEEFLAFSWFLDDVPEGTLESTITNYIECIRRVTGVIPPTELIMLKHRRDQRGPHTDKADEEEQNQGRPNLAQASLKKKGVDFLRLRSQHNLFSTIDS